MDNKRTLGALLRLLNPAATLIDESHNRRTVAQFTDRMVLRLHVAIALDITDSGLCVIGIEKDNGTFRSLICFIPWDGGGTT